MSHRQQREFCESLKNRFKRRFINANVLDVGSLDVNGSNRYLFEGGSYLGIDLVAGKGVDRVCQVQDVQGEFDVVISTECLEHDENWSVTIGQMFLLTKPGGLIVITCAGPRRKEHGTRKCPMPGMDNSQDYYGNLTPYDILRVIPTMAMLDHAAIYSTNNFDTYFWGIKK